MNRDYDYSTVNFENMKKLRDGLIANRERILLDMEDFAEDNKAAVEASPSMICNSPCCIVGFSNSFGVPVSQKNITLDSEYETNVNWEKHAEEELVECEHIFGFAFSQYWPNDIDEAITRIEMVLDKRIPEDWIFGDWFVTH